MIIKSISLKNFMCYYEKNTFNLSKGLNIILGENGEGKTKLFEAIEWLFHGRKSDLDLLISAKKLDEIGIGDKVTVSVNLSTEQHGESYHVTREFVAFKNKVGKCTIENSRIIGVEENRKGERSQVDGERLLDNIFPAEIRKYSLFKGESELNVFDNEDALINLVNMFADAKHFDKYESIGSYLYKAANKAVEDSTRLNSSNQRKYRVLESEIDVIKRNMQCEVDLLNEVDNEIDKLDKSIGEAEKYAANGRDLEIINRKIERMRIKIQEFQASLDERYTTNLFDEQWILMHFEPIFKEFEKKVVDFDGLKRKLQSDFDQEIGRRKGALQATADLLSNSVPLPVQVPSKEIMEELVRDQICKVCNTPAPEGSAALKFMKKRLNEYIESQKVTEDEEEEFLFENNYSLELTRKLNLHNDKLKDLREVKNRIKQTFEFNEAQEERIKKLTKELEEEEKERVKIIGKSSLGEDRLASVMKNYTGWQIDLTEANKQKLQHENKISDFVKLLEEKKLEKEKIDTDSANSYLIKTRAILKDISKIFSDTKEDKFNQFISILQELSNEYFSEINKGAFTGNIKFFKKNLGGKIRLEVSLMEEDRKLHSPNQSLETSMHISVLFAISKLAQENNEEGYPLLMDAPTSSFGETKTGEFLNIISGTENQIIVMLKDYLHTDPKTTTLSVKPEFNKIKKNKAFWVKLQRPFDPNSLKTINTEVIEL